MGVTYRPNSKVHGLAYRLLFDFSREGEDFLPEDNFDADFRSAVRRIEDDTPGDLNQRKSASKRVQGDI